MVTGAWLVAVFNGTVVDPFLFNGAAVVPFVFSNGGVVEPFLFNGAAVVPFLFSCESSLKKLPKFALKW